MSRKRETIPGISLVSMGKLKSGWREEKGMRVDFKLQGQIF